MGRYDEGKDFDNENRHNRWTKNYKDRNYKDRRINNKYEVEL